MSKTTDEDHRESLNAGISALLQKSDDIDDEEIKEQYREHAANLIELRDEMFDDG